MADRRLYAAFTLDYADSHKIAPLSDAAFRAHVRMILWSRRMLSDGRIPARMALVLADRKPKVLAELTSNDPDHPSLLRDENGDYLLHDFLDHQPSRAAVEAKQEINRANGARGGQAKAKRTATEPLPESVSARVADFYTETETKTKTPLPPPSEGGASATPTPVDNSEPPLRCPTHTHSPLPPNCGRCKDARIAHEAWAKARAAHPASSSRPPSWDTTTHCEHGQLIGVCEMCVIEGKHAAEVIHGRFGQASA